MDIIRKALQDICLCAEDTHTHTLTTNEHTVDSSSEYVEEEQAESLKKNYDLISFEEKRSVIQMCKYR